MFIALLPKNKKINMRLSNDGALIYFKREKKKRKKKAHVER